MIVLFLIGVAGSLSPCRENRPGKVSNRPIEEIIKGIPFSGGDTYNYLIVKT